MKAIAGIEPAALAIFNALTTANDSLRDDHGLPSDLDEGFSILIATSLQVLQNIVFSGGMAVFDQSW